MRKDRAEYGQAAVAEGTPDYGLNDDQTDLVDALANMMHYAKRQGLQFDFAVSSATVHFQAEVEEESEAEDV